MREKEFSSLSKCIVSPPLVGLSHSHRNTSLKQSVDSLADLTALDSEVPKLGLQGGECLLHLDAKIGDCDCVKKENVEESFSPQYLRPQVGL